MKNRISVSQFGNKALSLYYNPKQNGHQQAKSGVDRRSTSLFGCAAIQRNSIMAQMKLIPADNMKDKLWGKRDTPEREAMEAKLKEDVNAYIVGEAIRKARLAQNLTQEQLGERIGVQRAQISKLEKGTSVITLPTMSRVFQALGIATATLDLGIAGKIALW